MTYNSNIHHRRSIRLKGYDYTQAGLYFITICVNKRECLFGEINNGKIFLNSAGQMINDEWIKLPERFTNIQLHEYVVMPNHFHAILEIVGATLVVVPNNIDGDTNIVVSPKQIINEKGQPQGVDPTDVNPGFGKRLGDMIGAFESITTVKYIHGVKNNNWCPFYKKLWQRNYWEHIIRNEKSYNRISEYIVNNPLQWVNDKLNQPDG